MSSDDKHFGPGRLRAFSPFLAPGERQQLHELLQFGEGRSWKLLEKLVTNIADHLLQRFKPQVVSVEVKKFPIPQARYVSASLTRSRGR